MKERGASIGKAITGIMIFTLAGKLAGFFREITLSYYFGATGVSDAYLISQTIPGTIFQFVGTGLATCYIPIYFSITEKRHGDEKAFSNKILSIVLAFSTAVIAAVWLWPYPIVRLFASGFSQETMYYAAWFTRVGILSLYFSSLTYVFNSYLQANRVFAVTAFIAIPNSLAIILSIVLGAKVNIWLISVGSTLAVGAQLFFLWPAVRNLGYRPRIDLRWRDPDVSAFFRLMAPVILGVSVNEINTLIDRTVASRVAVGGISALTYAYSLIMLIQGGFVQSAANVYYPPISKAAAAGRNEEAAGMLKKAMDMVLCLLIPAAVGLALYSRPIVMLFFGRGVFDETAAAQTAGAVAFYALGLCFMGVRELLSRFYYANHNTKLPMRNAMIGVGANIILNLLLSKVMGLNGLALATSLSAGLTAGLLWLQLRRMPYGSGEIADIGQIGRSVLAAAVMAGVSYGCYRCLPAERALSLLAAVAVGAAVYLGTAAALKVGTITDMFENAWRALRRNKR